MRTSAAAAMTVPTLICGRRSQAAIMRLILRVVRFDGVDNNNDVSDWLTVMVMETSQAAATRLGCTSCVANPRGT